MRTDTRTPASEREEDSDTHTTLNTFHIITFLNYFSDPVPGGTVGREIMMRATCVRSYLLYVRLCELLLLLARNIYGTYTIKEGEKNLSNNNILRKILGLRSDAGNVSIKNSIILFANVGSLLECY